MSFTQKNIGILGAGQLGRMLAQAGYSLGQKFGFYANNPQEPSVNLGQAFYSSDSNSIKEFAKFSQVITYESENTDVEQVKELNKTAPVYPGEKSLYLSQNRGREKSLFAKLDIACAPNQLVNSLEELEAAIETIQTPAVLKTTTEGYDGKGQFVLTSPNQAAEAWEAIGKREAILEGFIKFNRELSIIAVRNPQGEKVFYPLVENSHRDGILRVTQAPAQNLKSEIQQEAESYMNKLLDELEHVGVLTLELFETETGLIANEVAPRVHNSGHWTMEGAQTSQFENHIRAICGLPLGATAPKQSFAAMVNIIGDHGDLNKILEMPNTHLHIYDKGERPARKLGHINTLANSQEELGKQLKELSYWINN